MNCVPVAALLEAFAYDPATGEIRWRHRPESHFSSLRGFRIFSANDAGRIATSAHGNGYLRCRITHDGRIVRAYAHRLAFCLQTGRWPSGQIDHIDGDRANNRWSNLREATVQENARNVAARRHNRSNRKWVKLTANGRFESRATVDGQSRYFGTFDTSDQAHFCAVRELAAIHGAFLRQGGAA